MSKQPITDRLAVGRHQMGIDPSTWPGPSGADDARDEAAMRRYVASGEFTQDALDWAGDHAHRHAALVDAICDFYADSPDCATVLEDIADGAREVG